jgi:uroporphyrinogen-III synthase
LQWPLIESAPSFSPLKLQSIFADWKNFDAVVIASPMGARLFTLEVVAQLTEADANHRPQIFAVGAATAEALAPLGWNVRLVEGDAGVDQGLLKAKQVLFAGAAESLMVPRLKEAGLKVTHLELYRTQASQHVLSEKCPVDLDSADASIVIASPSAARELALRWRKAKPQGELGAGLEIWAIGPSTSKELDRLQIAHQVNPKSGSWKALIQAIV